MKITIIAVGKIKESFYREAVAEYAKRLSRYCKFQILETPDEKTVEHASDASVNHTLEKEGERIRALIPKDSYVIATALEGKKYDSVEFSKIIQNAGIKGVNQITFIIGGSLGIHDEIKKDADERISFSDMTFPHQMMRVILSEQIYRAFKIIAKEPYHK